MLSQRCKNLVLDSGPLLSLSPLRGLAEHYLTVPQVLDEIKDKRAREHFVQLGLSMGIRISVRSPDPASITQVIQFAKKTGDYTALSYADICVLALTHTLQTEENARLENEKKEAAPLESIAEAAVSVVDEQDHAPAETNPGPIDSSKPLPTGPEDSENGDVDDLTRAANCLSIDNQSNGPTSKNASHNESESDSDFTTLSAPEAPMYGDPLADEDDGEGEWITPDNVALHKSRALELLPSSGGGSQEQHQVADTEPILTGCMTADFAMQNVLLQMGLTLVGTEGKRIHKVKTWVLRCHACFKICKDNSKQFCPSCGNPTLMKASVTLSSPDAAADAPAVTVHLKKNYQYKLRGTKYSIPAPRPGSAKTGTGEGLILREDQSEYMRAKKRMDSRRERDEQKMLKGLVDRGGEYGVAVGSWADPDWIPGMLTGSPKGRQGNKDGMPQIGYGRRNPNERRKR